MKIVFVTDSIYPYHTGGKEKRLFKISEQLVLMGYQVEIFTMQWWEGAKLKNTPQGTLHAVCKKKDLYVNGRRSIWQAVYFSGKLFFPLLQEKFDVIDADQIPFFPLLMARGICWLKHKQLYATWHEVWGKEYWRKYLGFFGYFAYFIEKITSRLPDKIIAVSNFTRNRLLEILHVPTNKITVVPNGVELHCAASIQKKYDLFFAGRLLAHKNVDVLIKTIALVKEKKPTLSALIIGAGPEYKKLEELIKKLKLEQHIELRNFVAEADFHKYFSQSKIFVSCSVREGFGIAVLEALAFGIPALVIDHPENAATELIQSGGNGYSLPLNEQVIAEKILLILNNPELYNKLVQQTIISAQKYSWDKIIPDLLKIYKQ